MTWSPLAALVVPMAVSALARAEDAHPLAVAVAPNDPRLHYVGRFAVTAEAAVFAWSGCAIEIVVESSAINAILVDHAAGGPHPVAGTSNNYFNVVVDDGAPLVLPLERGTTVYRVASGLGPGRHRVILYKRTEASIGAVEFRGLELAAGGVLHPAAEPSLEPSARRIEIIGDSITAGFGNEAASEQVSFSPSSENAYQSYGALTGRWLNAETSILAWSGMGLYRDRNGSTTDQLGARFRRVLPDDATDTWDFSRWIAGAVIINVGTNDLHLGDPGWPFVQAYVDLITDIRSHYPDAPMFACVGPMLKDPERRILREHIETALYAAHDANAFFVEFPAITAAEGYGADWHPSLATHSRMASELTHEVRVQTGWAETPPAHGGFVRVEGTHLMLNGGYFHFSGANSYSLLYSEVEAEEQFEIVRGLGLNALRLWGFWNGEDAPGSGSDRYGHTTLQPRAGVFPEEAWRKLDYVVFLAHLYGIKLVVALNNQWDEFGGIHQYLEWAGISVPKVSGHFAQEAITKPLRAQFWTNPTCKALYRSYVAHLLNRVNSYTGQAYKDDPAIMIWEVANEPRYGPWGQDLSASVVADWISEMAAYIKSIDVNHLVASGEEGFLNLGENERGRVSYPWYSAASEGVSFTKNGRLDDIDVLTIHAWPFQWSIASEYPALETFIPEWLDEHLRLSQEIGKPLYLGEFGWQILRRPGSDVADRDRILTLAYDAARAGDGALAGIAVWHITASHAPESAVYPGEIRRGSLQQATARDDTVPNDLDFRFDIFCPEDTSTCDLITAYSAPLAAAVEFPDPPYVRPCLAPWIECTGECVLLASHPRHCGACDSACTAHESCAQGACTALPSAPKAAIAESSGCAALPPCACVWLLLMSLGCLKLRRPIEPAATAYMDTTTHDEMPPVEETTTPSANFFLDGEPFCFSGTNNYYLTYKPRPMVDDVLAQAKNLGLKVIRIWAFIDRGALDGAAPHVDGDGTKDGVYFQFWDKKKAAPSFNDGATGLVHLDYVLHQARAKDLKVILVLTNNWRDFGGMDQYLAWYGLTQHHQFYTDARVQEAFKAWARHLIERKNSIDGMRYGDDPAIFAWELANEPRCTNDGPLDSRQGWDHSTLTLWADEMSAYLKSIDANHLVAVGDEGFWRESRPPDCVDHAALLALPHVDFGTFHLYPETLGTGFQYGRHWIESHIELAQKLGKPTILEEYGIRVKRDPATFAITHLKARREAAYRLWNEVLRKRGGNGSLFWMLAGKERADALYPDYDHYTIYAGLPTSELVSEETLRFGTDAVACKSARQEVIRSPFVSVR